MRVLALAHYYLPDHCAGAETMLHGMLRALAVRGHRVDVSLSRQDGVPYVLDGVNVWPHVDKRDIFYHYERGIDVLVSHLENAPRAAAFGNWNDIPVAMLNHNTLKLSKEVLVTPPGKVDLAVVNSQWMADDLRLWYAAAKRIRQPLPEVIVHRPTVDPAEHATTPGDRVALVNMRIDEMGVGHTKPMGKGGELFRRLAERMPDTVFLGVTGAYGTQQDMSGLPNVDVLPHLPNSEMREQVWSRTRVLLMPSSYESWGRVATEALCSGIPVIAHPTPGLRENLGDAGIFLDRNDTDGWVSALRTLADPDAWARASAAALARSAEHQAMRAEDEAKWIAAMERLGSRVGD